MAQDPNIPKLKTSEACLIQVDPLIQLADLICSAENQLSCNRMPESSARRTYAIKTIGEIRASDLVSGDLLDVVERELKAAGEYEITEETGKGLSSLRKAKGFAFAVLLDAAVDCECREAKAAYEQLSSEALQTVLGPETKGDGGRRPRRWTEIPAASSDIVLGEPMSEERERKAKQDLAYIALGEEAKRRTAVDKTKPTRDDASVNSWQERDRLAI